MKSRIVHAALSCLFLISSSHATELELDRSVPNFGVGVYSNADVTWRSRAMIDPEPLTDADRSWSGPDFFEAEYGRPCKFGEDFIGEYGYSGGATYSSDHGSLAVLTGPQGFAFGFGGVPGERDRPSVRPGAAWGRNRKDLVRLQMTLEQDVDATQWALSSASPAGYKLLKSFTIAGRGRQTFEADVALVREITDQFSFSTGIKFECQTPNVHLRIEGIKLAPSSANIYFRKTFTLPNKPISAHASFDDWPTYDLYVNGQQVATGNHLYPSGPLRDVDLTPYLTAGSNTIAYRKEFYAWYGDAGEAFLFEGAAIGRDGAVTRLLGGDGWRCAYHAAPEWMSPAFDDSQWRMARPIDRPTGTIRVPSLTTLADGTIVPDGIDPRYMGALDVRPEGRRYPLFDCSETPAFRVALPAGLQGRFKVAAAVYKAGTNDLVERATAPAFHMHGDFTTAVVRFKTRAVGPYRVMWELTDLSGHVMEQRREELLILGPIAQDKLPLAGFEGNLEKRLRRVIHIACTAAPSPDEFLDHSGLYAPTLLNKGRVTTVGGLTYRETGSDYYDYFAYRLHGLQRGQPYMVEVVVPDDSKRAIYSGVIESHPIGYVNNAPGYGRFSATGAARTGGLYPLTHTLRSIRYIYYPSSAEAGVIVLNSLAGSRAAASEINVYAVAGGLPALAVPASTHLFGSHEERMTVAACSFASENPLENDLSIAANDHRDVWYHWYRILKRKIELLRFQGRNMSVEGVYMYHDPYYPKGRATWISDDSVDLPLLAIKMYQRNGIKLLLGVEYVDDPAIGVDGVDTVSDRRMWLGEPSVQTVDRYGRQVGRGIWGNENFLQPTGQKYFNGILGELYNRYHGAGAVEGIYLVAGGWWQPGFTVGTYYNLHPDEVGYGDYTAALFEKETGAALGIDARDPKRFEERYALLTGQYQARWRAWRAAKLRDCFLGIHHLVESKAEKWKLVIEPSLNTLPNNPFADSSSDAARRAAFFDTQMQGIDMPSVLYTGLPGVSVTATLPGTGWKSRHVEDNDNAAHGQTTDPATGATVARLRSLNIGGTLDEIDCPTAGAARWIWTQGLRGVFIPRGIGDNAMNDFVNVLAHGVPDTVVYSWIDCNMETAFGPQLRRFAKSFYVTPPGATFTALPASQVHGVIAQTTAQPGGLCLRLINNSPYPLNGIIRVDAAAAGDLVYDAHLLPQSSKNGIQTFSLSLLPNDIRIINLPKAHTTTLRCDFDYTPDIAAAILARGAKLLADPDQEKEIPSASRAALVSALARRDAFAVDAVLESWEVLSVTTKALKEG